MIMSQRTIDNPGAVSYNTIDHPKVKDFVCFLIKEGEFDGVVFHYENLKINDELEDNGDALLKFNYHIVESFIAEEMLTEEIKTRFEDTIAGILYDILLKQVGKIGNEDRADDSEESGS
jgi:hypothetical protein